MEAIFRQEFEQKKGIANGWQRAALRSGKVAELDVCSCAPDLRQRAKRPWQLCSRHGQAQVSHLSFLQICSARVPASLLWPWNTSRCKRGSLMSSRVSFCSMLIRVVCSGFQGSGCFVERQLRVGHIELHAMPSICLRAACVIDIALQHVRRLHCTVQQPNIHIGDCLSGTRNRSDGSARSRASTQCRSGVNSRWQLLAHE